MEDDEDDTQRQLCSFDTLSTRTMRGLMSHPVVWFNSFTHLCKLSQAQLFCLVLLCNTSPFPPLEQIHAGYSNLCYLERGAIVELRKAHELQSPDGKFSVNGSDRFRDPQLSRPSQFPKCKMRGDLADYQHDPAPL